MASMFMTPGLGGAVAYSYPSAGLLASGTLGTGATTSITGAARLTRKERKALAEACCFDAQEKCCAGKTDCEFKCTPNAKTGGCTVHYCRSAGTPKFEGV